MTHQVKDNALKFFRLDQRRGHHNGRGKEERNHHPGEQKGLDGKPTFYASDRIDGDRRHQCASKTEQGKQEKRAPRGKPRHDPGNDPKGSPTRHAQHIRVGQGVSGDRLKPRTRQRQGGTDNTSQQRSG